MRVAVIIGVLITILAISGGSPSDVCSSAKAVEPQGYLHMFFGSAKNVDLRKHVEFFLHVNKTDKGQRVCEIKESFDGTGFNASWPVRFLIHGWKNSRKSAVNTVVKDAYFQKGNFNVFVVDWSKVAEFSLYHSVVSPHVYHIGDIIGMFAIFLNKTFNVPFDNMYLIGHSLGGQVAGAAGRYVMDYANAQFNTIFALDPAGPNFEYHKSPRFKVNQKDAAYVEVIHTDTFLGFDKPVGHADFYPNFGERQPGCLVVRILPLEYPLCSHERSIDYFAESINRPVWGKKCTSYQDIKNETCNYCTRIPARMGGEPSTPNQEGVFYVPVKESSPYGAMLYPTPEDVRKQMIVKLYSPSKKEGVLVDPTSADSLKAAGFNSSLPIRFLVSSFKTKSNAKVVNAYQQKGDFNVFQFDWSKLMPVYKKEIFDDDIADSVIELTKTLKSSANISTNQITVVAIAGGARVIASAAKCIGPEKFDTLFVMSHSSREDPSIASYIQYFLTTENVGRNRGNSTIFIKPNSCYYLRGCRQRLGFSKFTEALTSGLTGRQQEYGPESVVATDPPNREIKGVYFHDC